MYWRRKSLLFLLLIFLGGCRSEGAGDNPRPTDFIQNESPIRVLAEETPEAQVTSTLVVPAATFTPIPTVTSSVVLSPTTESVEEATILLATEQDFGDTRNPLTGEEIDQKTLDRRPIAVKISNSPAQYTRPQAGLGQADLVFEHVTEGPITRFTAIFYSQTPPKVGPIRSARLIDLELPVMYDAALAFSGSSIGVSRRLFNSEFTERILRTNLPAYYRSGEDKPYEHTLYAEPELLWSALDDRDENHRPDFATFLSFSNAAPDGGELGGNIEIRYANWTRIEWRYNPDDGHYLRWVDGEIHQDANTQEQLSASNIVFLLVPHRLETSICEFQSGNQCLAFSTEIQLWGSGDAVVFRDGLSYEAKWLRENSGDMITLDTLQGDQLPLQIGNTWFQVMPIDYTDPLTVLP